MPDTAPVWANERNGTIDVPGGSVWYRIVGEGEGDATPLLALHGGPGVPSVYLSSLAGLAGDRPVIFYDQLGCGNSEQPAEPALWWAERFVAELAAVIAALRLDRVHILGQSWGSMLATDYALTRPGGIASLILASPPLSIPRWLADARAWIAQMPAADQEVIARHEAEGTVDHPDYLAATDAYYRRHVCRMDPYPEAVREAFATTGHAVYNAMWGPNEFFMTGNLKDYDRSGRLAEIDLPTLFTCGRYDEATPEATAWYASLVPGAQLAIFDNSSHMAHIEEEAAYLACVGAFLREVDARDAP
jgi:proline iminopeptidase